jgi:nicotinate phosphoribosyltransferase
MADLISDNDEDIESGKTYTFYHPGLNTRKFTLDNYEKTEPLLHLRMQNGKRTRPQESLDSIQKRSTEQLSNLDETFKRFLNPHIYKISLSEKLMKRKKDMIQRIDEQNRSR